MAPAASIHAATSGAAATSKRPAASDAEQLVADSSALPQVDDAARKSEQPKQQQLECPRCRSTNTKFCYYNNYSTAQPRHFCRACRRYWTHGGTLRDVPRRRHQTPQGLRRADILVFAAADDGSARRRGDACPADLLPAAFPFLSDGSFLLPPQFDLGAVNASAAVFSSWPSAVVPDFFDGIAPWDDGMGGAACVTGAWGDIAGGLELSWLPPPGN
ncbi:hypothetical protein EJB05_40192 [Eragrostis curvula]|uniref:Dof zinc finger protein n=1 Tax=Eragrostis curvula TaxID=38414 RepID=A0A5J9TZ08_9POAL|nr:hypothetical protein EJB05_40192 [Eragrostis curvula]